MLELVVEAVAEREAGDELRLVAVDQVEVLGVLQEVGIEVAYVHHVDVDGPQREGRVAGVAPLVGEPGARQRAPVVGAVLEVDRQLELGLGLVGRAERLAPRQQEAREGEARGDAELRGAPLARVARLHELVAGREGGVEGLGAAEDVAVLVAHRGLQPVEARRGAPLQVDLEALPQRRRAEDLAREVALARQAAGRRVGTLADVGDQVGRVGALRLLAEGDAGALEVAEGHQVAVGAAHQVGVVDIVGIERHGAAQDPRTHPRAPLVHDVEAAVGGGVEARGEERVGAHGRGVVVGQDADPPDAVDGVVLQDRVAAPVVPLQVLVDDHAQPHAVVARQRVGAEAHVAHREVVVAPPPQVGGDALALAVEPRDVEDVARAQEGMGRVGEQDGLQKAVAELVGDGVDAVGAPLVRAVGHGGAAAPRHGVDLELGARGEEAPRVHVDLQILEAAARELHVEQHGRLAQAALPVVPLVVLRRVGPLVEPHVEVGPQQPLVGGLPHVLLQLRGGYALTAPHRVVGHDAHLVQQEATLGQAARDAAPRREEDDERG